ncbi:restriction endonuclease subunit S [Oscillospiraceae bacterium CM]|nr:restriction endonuclease subunit S [Oscillospiraceae bacterium CM]
MCSKIGSGATPKGGKQGYSESGISLIRSTNVLDYSFSYSDLAHISDEQADVLLNVEVSAHDVLFNITGVSVARCCMVPEDVLPARVNQHVMIVRPIQGCEMSYYIMCTLCSTDYKARLLGIGQSGSTREAINKQELESFVIPVPSINDIKSFGRLADSLYKEIAKNNNEIRALNDMQSVLLSNLSSR